MNHKPHSRKYRENGPKYEEFNFDDFSVHSLSEMEIHWFYNKFKVLKSFAKHCYGLEQRYLCVGAEKHRLRLLRTLFRKELQTRLIIIKKIRK